MSVAYRFLRGAVWSASLPPLGLARATGRSVGKALRQLDGRRRRIVRQNLAVSFPEKDDAWVVKTARACFAHLGQVVMEIPRLVRMDPKEVHAHTRFHGQDHLHEAWSLRKGVILLTGHFGNWEWANVAGQMELGGRGVVVARPIDWEPADRLVNYWRCKSGGAVLPKARSARALLRALKEDRPLGLLLDQNVDWYDVISCCWRK